ncbi:MAG TPA: hypothetical protein VHD90_08905 [Phototrophicaceae bacterium]|nr:hypothetical protein [Phototrophicaceae bacterium]
MRYETFLFTRNQRLDFTAFIRPALLTNKEVSTIGGIFNYVTDVSRLTPAFPSLYFFPLGAYLLLLRHYNSGRQHAGRDIGVIEGIAVQQEDAADFSRALPSFVEQQADLLNVSGTVDEIESLRTTTSAEQEWTGRAIRKPVEPFVATYLDRRAEDRLFLPFTPTGRDLLIATLADKRMPIPSFFAFGTNSDVLAQLDQRAAIDIASFFTTDRPGFRNRVTQRLSEAIDGYEPTILTDPSMSLRSAAKSDEINLRAKPVPATENEDTLVEYPRVSLRSKHQIEPEPVAETEHDSDDTSTILTIRQMRDKVRAEEAADQPAEEHHSNDPIHWLLHLFSSLVSPNKPK